MVVIDGRLALMTPDEYLTWKDDGILAAKVLYRQKLDN